MDPYGGYSSTQGPSGGSAKGPGFQAGVLPGASPYSFTPAYGGKPQVPSPVATAGAATSGNIGNLPALTQLGGGVNQFNTEQTNAMLSSLIPNYAGMTQQASGDILQNLAGNVPTDVINQIIQSAAERGVVTGGGPNANAAYLRALGLTSLGQQAAGQQQLNARIGATPFPKPFDVTGGMVTPEQQQAAQTASNVYAAAPDPMASANAAMNALTRGMGVGGGGVSGAPGMTAPAGGGYPMNFGFGAGNLGSGAEPGSPAAYNSWNSWWNTGGAPATDYSNYPGVESTGQPNFGSDIGSPVADQPPWGTDLNQMLSDLTG